MTSRRALIIGPDSAPRVLFSEVVGRLGFEAIHVDEGPEALKRFRDIAPSLIIFDLALPDLPSRPLLGRLARSGQVPVIAVVEAAILIETGSHRRYDKLILVTCAEEQQVERAMRREGAMESDVRARLSRKATGTHGASSAAVTESPLANSVTSCPRRTSSSVRYETIRSDPP